MNKENVQVIEVRTSWKNVVKIKIRDPRPDEFKPLNNKSKDKV